MKTRKLYMALVGILMSTQLANAQQNMLLVDNNGEIKAISVSSVDYVTFKLNDKLFTISNDGIEDAGGTFITAKCTVKLSSESNVKTLSVTPEVGVCYSKDNTTPTEDDDCKWLGSSLKSYTFSLSSLIPGTTYYYRVYVKLAGGVFYGDVAKAKTLDGDNFKIINGHKFVDLGLPSGLLWAETNIGAKTAADDGNYYAWGETSTKSLYDSDTYFDSNYTIYSISGETTLGRFSDAAYRNWGYSCRMPTSEEFKELCNSKYCTWTWTSMTTSSGSSVKGYKVTSVKNGNSIFLPASGYRDDVDLDEHGSLGHYWSSTLNARYSNWACYLYFDSSRHPQESYDDRCIGCTVRPVAKP